MTQQTQRKFTLVLSISLFVALLTQKSYCTTDSCGDALPTFILGPFAVMLGGAGSAWLANPLLFFTWIGGGRYPRAALVTSLLAVLLAFSFLLFRQKINDEAGHYREITAYKAGYWLWVSSAVVMLLGSVAFYLKSVRQK